MADPVALANAMQNTPIQVQPKMLASALVSPEQAGMPIPTTPMGTVRDFLNFGIDRLYAPVMDALNRTAMTPGERQAAMLRDPDFAKAARDWDSYMNYYRNVESP